MMRISKVEAAALAAFVGRIRPDWDHPGIVAAIEKATTLGSPAAIGAALCRLAENYEIRSPALLSEPGRHWAGTTVATRLAPVMCPEHPAEKAGNCRKCESAAVPPTDAYRAARAAIPHRTPIHTHPEPPATDLRDTRARAEQEQP